MSPAVTSEALGFTPKDAAKLRVLTICDLATSELEMILHLLELALEFGDLTEDGVVLFTHEAITDLWKKLTNTEERADIVTAALKKAEEARKGLTTNG